MTLSTGAKLGPYEVVSPLGAGGMGEVYRARDARLGRDVAVKVLPASFAADAERLRRFEQEARATSALDHPNILAIHDIGTHDGSPYVVSELLEGEALREKLGGSPLPLRKAIDHGTQIARGLAAAHDRGIVHRDLKPENLFVTRDGRVKILDFGLAKLVGGELITEGETRTTGAAPNTDAGRVVGTVGYMSPEQVRAQPVDHRSDIFSFGAVLYEMLSGRRAFRGASAVETMNAILKEDPPPLSETSRNLPPALERIVSHCLEKSPDERFQSARDIAFDLEAVSGQSAQAPAIAAAPMARARWMRNAGLAAGAVVAVVAAFLAGRRTAERSQAMHEPLTFRRGTVTTAGFAPDGRTVVYSARWEGKPVEIFTTQAGSPESRTLGLVDASFAGVSANGELAVILGGGQTFAGTLARVPLGGGAPREVLEGVFTADWGPDGASFAVVRAPGGRTQVEYPIGTVLHGSAAGVSWLRISPNGDRVAFCEHPVAGDARGDVVTVDLAGKRTVLSSGWEDLGGLAWRPDGQEVWFTASKEGSDRALYAAPLSGEGRLVERVPGHLELKDISRTGDALLSHGSRRPIMIARGAGQTQEVELSWLDYPWSTDISADGKMILFSEQGIGGGPGYSVYLRAMDGSPAVRLGKGLACSLSPDGKWALTIALGPSPELVLLPTGAGEPRRLPKGPLRGYHWAGFFPDGKRALVTGYEEGKGTRLYVQDFEGGIPRAISPEGVFASGNPISPDGTLVAAFTLDFPQLVPVAGGDLRPIPGSETRDGPLRWSADGRSLYVRKNLPGPARVFRIDLPSGKRELWRELAPADMAGVRDVNNVQIAPDGKAYAYTYARNLSNLYLVKGLK